MVIVQHIETTWYKNERGAMHGTLRGKTPEAMLIPTDNITANGEKQLFIQSNMRERRLKFMSNYKSEQERIYMSVASMLNLQNQLLWSISLWTIALAENLFSGKRDENHGH